jgi:20S proteasome alpha/beta subunit
MTICIAIACDCNQTIQKNQDENQEKIKPKIIMVADRMLTMRGLDTEFEFPKAKLTQMTNNCAIATAGNALAVTEIVDAVKQKLKIIKHSPPIHDIALFFKDAYVDLRRKEIEDEILKPVGINSLEAFYKEQQNLTTAITLSIFKKIKKHDHNLSILIGGVDKSGAHIFAIDDPGVMCNLDEMGYDAIGSGNRHALLAFIGANYHSGTLSGEAMYLAYKAKRMSEKAPGIGTKYTDIWVIEDDAIYEMPHGDDISIIGIKKLEAMYTEEIKHASIPFEKLAEVVGQKIKRPDTEFLQGYA